MSAPELRTPAEWSAQDGVTVMDPDGWRGTRTLPAKSWDEPISHDEWQQRLSVSTRSLRTVPAEQTNVIDQVAHRLLPPLRERVAREISRVDGGASSIEPCGDATYEGMADAALSVVEPELERLTAEVTQLRADMRIRQGALNDVLGHDRSQDTPTDYYRAVEDVAELRREVSRLREQLAAQQEDGDSLREQLSRMAADYSSLRNTRLDEGPQAIARSAWLDVHHRDNVGGEHGRGFCRACAAFIPEAQRVFPDPSWGVSSSEVEASRPPRHEVRMHPCADRFHAKCQTCGEFRCGDQAQAEDWKDQHEADTLRPVLTNESFISSQDEGRPSGSERLAPQWREGDVVLDRRSSRSAPVPDDGGIPWHERHDAVMAERDDWRQACEEAEARNVHLLMLITDLFGDFRDAATKYSELVDEIPEHVLDLMNYWTAQRDREQQDAAQAARSGASPEGGADRG